MLALRSATRYAQIPSTGLGRIAAPRVCAPSASVFVVQQRLNSSTAGIFSTSRLEGKTGELLTG